ncbi:hypothetical protein DPMN_180656 [Dreissena polymorpha]|uniref:Alpha-carbonic anhydrase domain-containing protein n=1 Tax=Dreissena polymorpha TaxID=45954 RepID=A0A9D4EJJ8_DREPO|nr:hypothetical protein DPMN_180656 [Dreissena polymorpha]
MFVEFYILNHSISNKHFNSGPYTWYKHFLIARTGIRQSPINIVSFEAEYDDALMDMNLEVSYQAEDEVTLKNNGHNLQCQITQLGCKCVAMFNVSILYGECLTKFQWSRFFFGF